MYDLFNQPINKPIDFPIVSAQNNAASTDHYKKMKKKLGGQRLTIYNYLSIPGNELTRKKAINELDILDPVKRFEELDKQFGIKISKRWNNPQTEDFMIWFMSESDKIHNNNLMKKAG